MTELSNPEQSGSGEPCVICTVIVAEHGQLREETRERFAAPTIGAALDAFAPDPAQGACFAIRIEGRGRCL